MEQQQRLPFQFDDEPDYFLFPEITSPKKRAYLTAYAETGGIVLAGQVANVHWRNHYNWIRTDSLYAEAFERARSVACDLFEDEVTRRGFHGTDEPQFYRGNICGYIRRYSDILLMYKLNGERGDKFKRRAAEAPRAGDDEPFVFSLDLGAHQDSEEKRGTVDNDNPRSGGFSFYIGGGDGEGG